MLIKVFSLLECDATSHRMEDLNYTAAKAYKLTNVYWSEGQNCVLQILNLQVLSSVSIITFCVNELMMDFIKMLHQLLIKYGFK